MAVPLAIGPFLNHKAFPTTSLWLGVQVKGGLSISVEPPVLLVDMVDFTGHQVRDWVDHGCVPALLQVRFP